MAELLPSLVVGLIPNLCEVPPKPDGFGAWLVEGTYQLDPIISGQPIELSRVSYDELVPYFSRDFERFSLACKESLLVARAEKDGHNLAGWPLLKLYYAAFFGAHAIMRSQGRGVVFLTAGEADHLTDLNLIVHNSTTPVTRGVYSYELIQSQTGSQPAIRIRSESRRAGVHESFWKLFCKFLKDSANNAASRKLPDSSAFVVGASEISNAIFGPAHIASVWLSQTRNEINYQHRHKTWFPIRTRDEPIRALSYTDPVDSKAVRIDLSCTKTPIQAFVNTTRYLAFLSSEISSHVAERSTANGSFGQKWRRLLHAFGGA